MLLPVSRVDLQPHYLASMLDMQSLRPHPVPAESESAFCLVTLGRLNIDV